MKETINRRLCLSISLTPGYECEGSISNDLQSSPSPMLSFVMRGMLVR